MATATIEKTKTAELKREVPRIPQAALAFNDQTSMVYRAAFVRLPDGTTLQDLNDTPTVWQNVQNNQNTALRKWDQVRCVAYDEAWFVDATVSHADRTKVILCGVKKTDMPRRDIVLFEDELYRVDWAGSGYGVFRKSDDVLMGGQTFQNAESARHYIVTNLYAKRVA